MYLCIVLVGVSQLGGADLCGGYAGGGFAPTIASANLMIPALKALEGRVEAEMRVILLRRLLLSEKKKVQGSTSRSFSWVVASAESHTLPATGVGRLERNAFLLG